MGIPDNVSPIQHRKAQLKEGVEPTRGIDPKEREAPNTTKDFKEVMDERAKERPHVADDINDVAKKRGTSLFDLAKEKTSSLKEAQHLTEDSVAKALPESVQDSIPAKKLHEKMTSTKVNPEDIEGYQSDEVDNMARAKKAKFNSEYGQHSPDISYLDPSSMGIGSALVNAISADKVQQKEPVASPIHDIVTELIDKLVRIETKGQTDTVVTINKPGIFKDAIIVISEFQSANGQLNLAFENLRNEAKNLLDSQPNRDLLFEQLKEKGYVVNQFITTTITEHKPIVSEEAAAPNQYNQNPDRDNPDQPKKRQR